MLIHGKTTDGKFYVRPMDWSGIWDSSGNLSAGGTLFESESELQCQIYMEDVKRRSQENYTEEIDEVVKFADNNLRELICSTPDCVPIIFLCGENCYPEDSKYMLCVSNKCEVKEITIFNEKVYSEKSDLESDIRDFLEETYPNADYELMNTLFKENLELYKWETVLLVYID